MGYRFSLDDVGYLRSDEGVAAIRAAGELPLTAASRLADVTAVRGRAGERAGAVLETAVLRRKADAKQLPGADRWLFTDDALQQATPGPVGELRAARLAGRDVHDVTCSVGADLIAVARVARRALGSDLDEVRLAMAAHNVGAAGVNAGLARADALRPVSRDTAVLADPARRDGARRVWKPEDLHPPLGELAERYAGRDLSVKCAPGLDFAAVPWAAEVELVSLDGMVREACAWTGSLATPGVSRRATVLRTGAPQWTITDADPDDADVREPGGWIVDPDGAVVRAGLVRHYAVRHGLGQLDPRIAYLTGDTPPPGVRAFRVLDHAHYTEKALRARLRQDRIGTLEILVRGLPVDPDALRRSLKLSGPGSATVVLTRIGRRPEAFLCRAERTPCEDA